VIETERLILRKPKRGDAKALHAAYSDPEVMRYIGLGDTMDLEQTRAWVDKALRRWKADGFGHYAIERKEDGRVLGRAGFLVWNPDTWQTGTLAELGEHSVVELGWMLAQEHWGNGYAVEAALALRDYGFQELDLARLISLILRGNDRSVRVAEKIGSRYVRDVSRGEWTARLYAVNR
jgi:[ribosomal protein S5]-alanine N-acetyltransferase